MTATVSDNLPRPLGCVVHIGAGEAADMPRWLAAGAERVVLIEADPEIAARLQARAEAHPQVQVIEAAVSADTRSRPFRRMNFPDLNAFRSPTGLKALFPGLQVLSEERVRPRDPVTLIEPLALRAEAGNLLIVETPGESLGILKALDKAGLLARFAAVRVQEGREVLYNRAPTAAELRDFLAGAGFEAAIDPDPADPDRPHVLARSDPAARAWEAQIAALREKLAQAGAERDTARKEAETARAEAERRQARIAELQGEAANLRKRAETLQAERDAAHKEAETARTEAERRQARIAELQGEAANLRKRAETLQAERDAARKEAETARTEAERRQARIAELQGEAANLRRTAETLQAERDEAAQARERAKAQLAEISARLERAQADAESLRRDVQALKKRAETAEAACDVALGEAGDARAAIAEKQARIAELQDEIGRLRASAEALQGERDEARNQAGALRAELEKLRAEAAERAEQLGRTWKKVETLQADLGTAQRNLSMALRMQTLREADLKDLQDRHGRLLRQKEAQDGLLRKLTATLSDAAEHLRRLDELPAPAGEAAAPARRRIAAKGSASGKGRRTASPAADD